VGHGARRLFGDRGVLEVFSARSCAQPGLPLGEDGLLGICDRQGRMCFSLCLWNGLDPILKERLFGLNGDEGNHGEDVKESYFYLDSTPTHSYMKALYKYPQRPYPYQQLVAENARRGRGDRELNCSTQGSSTKPLLRCAGGVREGLAQRHSDSPADRQSRAAGMDAARAADAVFRNGWSWGRKGKATGQSRR